MEKTDYIVDGKYIKVPIKDKLKKGLIFGIDARLPLAIIAGQIGYKHEVRCLMQNISHSTRAYMVNVDGLKNFLNTRTFQEAKLNADG